LSEINVLCVDDEEELISAWVERLLMRGIEAEGVTNGHDAIRRVKERRFDVVLMDIKMPGISGEEIMKRIKDETPDIPIILITGDQCPDEGQEGMLAGSFACLVKPVDIEILVGKIREAVKD